MTAIPLSSHVAAAVWTVFIVWSLLGSSRRAADAAAFDPGAFHLTRASSMSEARWLSFKP